MYKKHDINLFYRFIGLLLWLLTIVFIENIYVLIILFTGIFVLNKKNNIILFFMLILTTLFFALKFMDNAISLVNIMLIIDYIMVFVFRTSKDEYIMLKNIILKKEFTYKQLEKEYRKDISKKNIDNLENSKIDEKKKEEIKERLVSKDNSDVFDKLVINYLRFYKNQNDNNKKLGINKETIIYLSIHLIILICAVVL